MFQRADGKWIASISSGPREARKVTRRVRDSQAAALEALRRLRAEDTTPLAGDPPPAFDRFMETWLADTKARVRPATYKQYKSVSDGQVVPAFGPMRIDRTARR